MACWCGCVRPVDNRTALLILQTPDEGGHAKGTAAVLARCCRTSSCGSVTASIRHPPSTGSSCSIGGHVRERRPVRRLRKPAICRRGTPWRPLSPSTASSG
ncbi:MAG: hypothetical protein EOP37_19315 [Rubrivivax sp.]|nr:MAG: hypothetical protein EOP37_19315 [Rubrivivax sp.]